MADNPKDITPKILLEHMQGMKQELLIGQARLETKLTKHIGGLDQKLTVIQTGIQNIDTRLDEVELEFLPKRMKRVEERLGLPPFKLTTPQSAA